MKNKHLYIFIILISFSVNAQEKKDWYSTFGKIPTLVDTYLYNELKNAEDFQKRAKLIDTIASIHIQTGITDSIVYYGNLLQDEVLLQKELLLNRNFYLSKAYHILGKGKLEKGLYDDAMKHYLDGIAISPASEMSKMHYTHQLGLGAVYLHQKEYDAALSIFETIIKNTENNEVLILAKKSLADVFFAKKDVSKAKANYLEVLNDLRIYENNKIRLETQLKLGRIDIFEDNLSHALEYFRSVKEVALQSKFYDLYIDAVIQMGIIYYNQGHLQDAEIILSSAYVNSIQWNKLELQRDVIMVLRNIKVAEKDYENAYNLMTQYLSISNQILKNQNKEIVKDLEIKYQTLQKEKEILSLKEEQLLKESEIKRQRTIKKAFLIGFLVVLIPVIALLFLYFQKLKTQIALNKSQKEVNSQKVYGLMKDQELNLVKATMDGQNKERKRLARELHDSIGGNLASIKLQLSSHTSKNENTQTKILNQIDETYHQVRDLSHNLASKKFQNNGISTLIKEYVNNIEQGSNQKISFNPHPEEKINEIENPLKEELFKIIQELLTNTLKHAKADQIDIYLNQYQTILQLLFEDNGIGFNSEKMAEGIGFKNIKNRLHSLSGNMVIDSTIDRGTVINIEIPVS
ncbi:histidine kinase [uncultured Aquimarina sp.]|uniref:tetratricopeptide repeat-containing sensor histidine kinase n=1 Tax=uncultured Aquimarina sp. TaxID=575652 RepID=UPI002631F4E1|nr:histidine kinase [uncultured Aquimarina sp.]